MSEDPTNVLKPITETAKAVQEASKLGVEITKAAAGSGSWLDGVFGDSIRDVVGLLGDRVHYARLRAAVADEARLVEVILLAKGQIEAIDPSRRRRLSPKFGLAWLENASVEDDETLQQMWANLLASAVDDDEDPATKAFVTILSDLELEDAVALEDYYHRWTTLEDKPFSAGGVTYGPGLDGEAYGSRVTANLYRLGLVEPGWMEFDNYVPETPGNCYGVFGDTSETVRVSADLLTFRFTGLGTDFCKAVGMERGKPGEARSLAISQFNRPRR